ncbi:hypothetical protein EJ02DRAFT_452343 [Clathrospora elynae]|uniref:Uncharacterized protein n=1 Tax=Clathrospora elynae TaxID=706981 RepID=A0A6A5SYL0_9PLEO|nr:hypothetical protein EJ02DRAFT_452343 [Clathrospora elynae]
MLFSTPALPSITAPPSPPCFHETPPPLFPHNTTRENPSAPLHRLRLFLKAQQRELPHVRAVLPSFWLAGKRIQCRNKGCPLGWAAARVSDTYDGD